MDPKGAPQPALQQGNRGDSLLGHEAQGRVKEGAQRFPQLSGQGCCRLVLSTTGDSLRHFIHDFFNNIKTLSS